jgi:hypothetical protein
LDLLQRKTPGGDLVQILLRCITILPQEENLRIVPARVTQKRHDRAGTRMPDHF